MAVQYMTTLVHMNGSAAHFDSFPAVYLQLIITQFHNEKRQLVG